MASLLDDYRRMMAWQNLGRLGQGLLMAGASGRPFGQALAMGLGNMQPMPGLMDLYKIQESQQEAERERAQETARSKIFGGYDPQTQITWNQGRPGLLGSPQGLGLMAQAYPEMAAKTYFKGMKPEKPYSDIAKLNADLAAGRITQAQFERSLQRLERPESQPSLTGRMRWIMATGQDPTTGKTYDDEQRALFQRAMAPGSAETETGFLRDWVLANARNFRTGPDIMEEGRQLWQLIQGAAPESPEGDQGFGEAAASGPSIPIPRRKPPLQGKMLPLPPMELDPDIKTRADSGTFTEAELIELQTRDPDQFELLYQYLKGK